MPHDARYWEAQASQALEVQSLYAWATDVCAFSRVGSLVVIHAGFDALRAPDMREGTGCLPGAFMRILA